MRQKVKYAAAAVVIMAILVSFPKIVFLAKLTRFCLSSDDPSKKNLELLAKIYLQNDRMFRIIELEYIQDDRFIISLCRTLLGSKYQQENNISEQLIAVASRKYPENIFLDGLQFYGPRTDDRHWNNFDPLFFECLEDKALNPTTFSGITAALDKGYIDKKILPRLIMFLNWKKNYSLSLDLTQWAENRDCLNQNIICFLAEDRDARSAFKSAANEVYAFDEIIVERLATLFSTPKYQISIDNRSVPSTTAIESQNHWAAWNFLDFSDKAPFSKGSYYGEIDRFMKGSARIIGFFDLQTKGHSPSRAGIAYQNAIPLEEKEYLVFFEYKTLTHNEDPSFWLSQYVQEVHLKPTGGCWQQVFFIFNNKSYKSPDVTPLLRIWGEGTVWFNNFFLAEIEIQGKTIEKRWLHLH
jgi:hypothetical protein